MNVSDSRPRDLSYMAIFKRKDLPSLSEMVKHIRETHDVDMIEDINQRFENKADSLANGISIQSVTKTEDLVVNGGLQQCINIILGTSAVRWRYMAQGGSTTAPLTSNTALGGEHGAGRLDMQSAGWTESRGMRLFLGAIMGESFSVNTISEIGVFNSTSGATMLNRQVFPNSALWLSRTISTTIGGTDWFKNPYILSSVIEFCPVV